MFGDLDTDAFLGFGGGGTEVWGEDEIWQTAQGGICGKRFGFKDIECGGCDMIGAEGIDESEFIDETASGAIDDSDPGLRFGESLGVEHVLGLWGERHMHGDEVGFGEDGVEGIDEFDL